MKINVKAWVLKEADRSLFKLLSSLSAAKIKHFQLYKVLYYTYKILQYFIINITRRYIIFLNTVVYGKRRRENGVEKLSVKISPISQYFISIDPSLLRVPTYRAKIKFQSNAINLANNEPRLVYFRYEEIRY